MAWDALEFHKQSLCKDGVFCEVCISSIHLRLSKHSDVLFIRLSKHCVTHNIMFVLNSDLINT